MVRLPSQIWITICLVFQTQQNSKKQILRPLIFKAFFFFFFLNCLEKLYGEDEKKR